MPKRDYDWNHQSQPRRISRSLRKTLQNAHRKYFEFSRAEIKSYVNSSLQENVKIPVRNLRRRNKIQLVFEVSDVYRKNNQGCYTHYVVDCHRNAMKSTGT